MLNIFPKPPYLQQNYMCTAGHYPIVSGGLIIGQTEQKYLLSIMGTRSSQLKYFYGMLFEKLK